MCSKNSCSSPDDIIDVTQENNADSNNVGQTLLNTSKISCKMIYNLLIHKDPRVILVENTKKHTSDQRSQTRRVSSPRLASPRGEAVASRIFN